MKLIITTYPFSEENDNLRYLRDKGFEIIFNQYKRKMSPDEVYQLMKEENPDIIIAGTEKYDSNLLSVCTNLKMISRVGIGMDSVNLLETSNRKITVLNTPDAPTNAVVELTIGQIFNSLRHIEKVSNELKKGIWNRHIGKSIKECKIGIIGYGRIGSNVVKKLRHFNPKEICYYDIDSNKTNNTLGKIVDKDYIIKNCDIISIHIPLNKYNENFISEKEFILMKKGSILINTSRGGIVNENNLYNWLYDNQDCFAAIDVFEEEPYKGNLTSLNNISLTPHLGSCTSKSREDMENESIKNVINNIIT